MLRLMWEFFKAGLFAIGGGMATFPFLQEMSEKYNWFSQEELLNMIAVSESTPGAIGINVASFAGYKVYGITGAILASLSLIAPAIIIILIISKGLESFKNSLIIKNMFETIRPATAGLILGAMLNVMILSLFNVALYEKSGKFLDLFQILQIIIFVCFLIVLRKYKKIHPIIIIAIGAVLGIVFKL
ncbi:chromate transporter [Anaerococcus sp. WCA-380-WT-2B]|uniref:Chromate transporter n=1 Tax=Anaerococcus porci TaxID=2652269 RepID=A0A6N7VV52_9FIRM|nr:chromate transporter [Anaerococcus porci]MSS78772.1 chromate transporter [Anaerococcus porci]